MTQLSVVRNFDGKQESELDVFKAKIVELELENANLRDEIYAIAGERDRLAKAKNRMRKGLSGRNSLKDEILRRDCKIECQDWTIQRLSVAIATMGKGNDIAIEHLHATIEEGANRYRAELKIRNLDETE